MNRCLGLTWKGSGDRGRSEVGGSVSCAHEYVCTCRHIRVFISVCRYVTLSFFPFEISYPVHVSHEENVFEHGPP